MKDYSNYFNSKNFFITDIDIITKKINGEDKKYIKVTFAKIKQPNLYVLNEESLETFNKILLNQYKNLINNKDRIANKNGLLPIILLTIFIFGFGCIFMISNLFKLGITTLLFGGLFSTLFIANSIVKSKNTLKIINLYEEFISKFDSISKSYTKDPNITRNLSQNDKKQIEKQEKLCADGMSNSPVNVTLMDKLSEKGLQEILLRQKIYEQLNKPNSIEEEPIQKPLSRKLTIR